MKKKRLAVTMILTSLTLAASMATPAMAAEKQIKVPRMTQQTTYEKMPGEKYRVREDNRFSYRKDGLIRFSMEEKYGNKRTVAYKYKNGLLSKVKINGKSSMDSYEWSEDGRTETIKLV